MKIAFTRRNLNEMVNKVYSLLNEDAEQEVDAWEGLCTDDEEEPGLDWCPEPEDFETDNARKEKILNSLPSKEDMSGHAKEIWNVDVLPRMNSWDS